MSLGLRKDHNLPLPGCRHRQAADRRAAAAARLPGVPVRRGWQPGNKKPTA
jgi:hypothetical protein